MKIRDAEINFEVLRLGGELQEARHEISRLRDKLMLSDTIQLTSPKAPNSPNQKKETEVDELKSEQKQLKGRTDFKIKLTTKPSNLNVPKLDLKTV
jgi:hypothetical protein